MISFQTQRFGSLGVEEDKIIHFPNGLLGFEEIKRYVLLDYKDTFLKWLQAVDNPEVAFIVAEPGFLSVDFSMELDAAARHSLKLKNDDDLAVLVIVRVDGDKVIANLNGPLVINSRLKVGMQAVSHWR